MPCLNLRLPPAKKAWKSFASKLQTKLHKLNSSKSIKKPRHRPNIVNTTTTASAKTIRSQIIPFEKRYEKRKRLVCPHRLLPFNRRRSRLFGHAYKQSEPVYVDNLFRESISAAELVAKLPSRAEINMKFLNHQEAAVTRTAAGTSMEDGTIQERGCVADDMWESLGFASPQLQGIDERAEQFILTFRAEMENQEMNIARGL